MKRPCQTGAIPLLLLCGCQRAIEPAATVPTEDPSAAYEALLQRVVTEDGYVDWTTLKTDRAALDAYTAWLGRDGALPDDRTAAHATWLNAYNAFVLLGVLENDVQDSVHDVGGWIPKSGAGFFYEQTYTIDGRRVNLYNAENTHIRSGFSDWRDHAALNCASASCPALRRELYDPARLEAQLDDQARRWAMDPIRGWRVDGDQLVFTPIFDWFSDDFPTEDRTLCAVLAGHATGERAATLARIDARGCPHTFFVYDWRLNRPGVRGERRPIQRE